MASTFIASFWPSFIAEPLPNARSICASAASNAFWRSASTFLSSTSFRLAAMTLPPALGQSRYRLFNWRVMYRLCSTRTSGERKFFLVVFQSAALRGL